ncbi:MAG: dethiobiotin synthase [Sediminibacterium sp.]|nr:dethiobiotin synthase [Sediminibacterium sp.]
MAKRYFITGIGTNVGKTVVSAVLTEALKADYWKPVQSGSTEGTDRQMVSALISNSETTCFNEAYCFEAPLSPNIAAQLENAEIEMGKIVVPETTNTLIIEGAGGILVPLNETTDVIDLALKTDAEVILVCSNYLGCINHSLLSIAYLEAKKIPFKGIILNGRFDAPVKRAILAKCPVPILAEIEELAEISKLSVWTASQHINTVLFE